MDEINNVNVEIQTFIENYFMNDGEIIRTCVLNARNLYATATTNEGTENVIACLSFGVIPEKGIFINWLVVSDEEIMKGLYGDAICFHSGNNNIW